MADLVSVVIPVYNTNKRFEACFESVLKQKYQKIEVILVDDGSLDSSAKICDAIALSTIRFPVYVFHKTNGGVSRARNLGIDFANGKYLVFIDSDDQVTPDYISDFIAVRNKYPDVGHVWCGYEWTSHHTKCNYSNDETVSFVTRDSYFGLAEKILTQSPWLRIYDISVLKQYNIRMNEELSLAEDLLFNLEYLDIESSKKICVINAANYIYVDLDSDSLNYKFREDLLEIYRFVLHELSQYMEKWGLTDSRSVAKYYNTAYYKYVEVLNNTFKPQNKMSYIKKLSFNNQVIRSEGFIDSLSLMSESIPKYLRMAYRTKNYFFVRVYERIVALYGWLKSR